jgi:hypothetical protein
MLAADGSPKAEPLTTALTMLGITDHTVGHIRTFRVQMEEGGPNKPWNANSESLSRAGDTT